MLPLNLNRPSPVYLPELKHNGEDADRNLYPYRSVRW